MSSSGLRNDPMTTCELFTQPPNNAKEKWRTVTRGSEVWLVRCHGKRRYQPYHPLRSGLPCSRGAADLEPMRIQVRFGENGERRLLMDTWDAPVVTDRSMHWVGYTLFQAAKACGLLAVPWISDGLICVSTFSWTSWWLRGNADDRGR